MAWLGSAAFQSTGGPNPDRSGTPIQALGECSKRGHRSWPPADPWGHIPGWLPWAALKRSSTWLARRAHVSETSYGPRARADPATAPANLPNTPQCTIQCPNTPTKPPRSTYMRPCRRRGRRRPSPTRPRRTPAPWWLRTTRASCCRPRRWPPRGPPGCAGASARCRPLAGRSPPRRCCRPCRPPPRRSPRPPGPRLRG